MALTVQLRRIIATEINASTSEQYLDTQKTQERLAQDIQQGNDVIIRQVGHCADELHTRVDRIEEQVGHSREMIISRVDQISNGLSGTNLEASTEDRITQIDRLIERRFRKLAADQDHQMQLRDMQSEHRFRHLEQVFRAIIAPPVITHAMKQSSRLGYNNTTDTDMNNQQQQVQSYPTSSCHTSCRCKCHRNGHHYTNWSLRGFGSTIGSVMFQFQAGSTSTCGKRHFRRVAVTYTFPTWLFHATVSASVSDRSGSPELNLRIFRRVAKRAHMLEYVERGDLQAVKDALMRKHSSIHDVWHMNGRTALHLAVACPKFQRYELRFLDLVQLLLAEGADLFQQDDFGQSPCQQIIQLLYINGTLPKLFRNRLESVLPMNRMIEFCGFTNLHKAVLGITNVKISSEYLRSRMDTCELNAVDGSGKTALVYASAKGNIAALEALLAAGATPEWITPKSSLQPFVWVRRDGYLKIIQMWLDAGADMTAKDGTNFTALHYVCNSRRDANSNNGKDGKFLRLVSQILAQGADRYALDNHGCSALDQSVSNDSASIAGFLLKMGLSPDHQDKEGTNALGHAIYWNSCESTAVLLRHGTDLDIIDNYGDGILHYLGRWGKVGMMNVFIEQQVSGLDIASRNNEGYTPIQLFDSRDDSTDVELRDKFWEVLNTVSGVQRDVVGQNDSDCESEQFFDASEGFG